MAGRKCYHCKQWIEEGNDHDCWTTTEAALTQDLSEDLRDAWERLFAAAEREIYAKDWDAEGFRRELRGVRRGQSIALGTATDPYQPAERRYELTRRVLEVLANSSGRRL